MATVDAWMKLALTRALLPDEVTIVTARDAMRCRTEVRAVKGDRFVGFFVADEAMARSRGNIETWLVERAFELLNKPIQVEPIDLDRAALFFGFRPGEVKAAWRQEVFRDEHGYDCWCELHGTDWEPEFFVTYEDWLRVEIVGACDPPPSRCISRPLAVVQSRPQRHPPVV